MNDETQAQRGYGFRVAVGLVLAPVLCDLSIGPTVFIVERAGRGRKSGDCSRADNDSTAGERQGPQLLADVALVLCGRYWT